MNEIVLTGQLLCSDAAEADLVRQYLPRHLALTIGEPGCLSFTVNPTADPLVWQVDERFTSVAAFRAHQDRVRLSEWGRATAGIERRYAVREVAPDES